MNGIRITGALALATVITVAASAQKVDTDADRSAPFASYKTYLWTVGTPSPNPLGERRIHAAVDGQLAAKGLVPAETTPNLYVATHVVTRNVPEIIANGFGPWGLGVGTATVQTYVQGTLIVDLYDANTRRMVWRGVATGTVSDKASKNTAKVDKAVSKMFQQYPPSAGSSSR